MRTTHEQVSSRNGDYIGCRITSFSSRVMPVLELAHSYDWQVEDSERDQTEVEERNVELMRIDSWFSYVGRLDEISEGPRRLLHQTPALVQLLMEEFEGDVSKHRSIRQRMRAAGYPGSCSQRD
ncbi:hypothetical protein CJF30_00004723 [Rutstroemia sp. NJR-2017a BBW]|nr:hypothetical protein CJF30_00004723 [Rutstroemia sp. NJR-2017a BBW]